LRNTDQLAAANARSSPRKSASGSSGGLARCQATERASASWRSVSIQPSRSQALEDPIFSYILSTRYRRHVCEPRLTPESPEKMRAT
jgi:hypothetical protein